MAKHSVSATQAKFIHSRIDDVEEHFGLMCENFATVARKNAKCRDAIDDLARIIVAYADSETLNRSMRAQVTHFADTLCGIADLQQTLVQKLESRVVGGFATYKDLCEHARDDLTTSFKAQGREAKTGQKLRAVREKAPGDLKQVSQAEANMQKAVFDVARTHAALEESIAYFEMKKLRDLRKFLLEFCHAHLAFHGKSLEMYSRSYNLVDDIQIEGDVEEFKKALMFPTGNLQYRTPDMITQSLLNFGMGQPGRLGGTPSSGRLGVTGATSSAARLGMAASGMGQMGFGGGPSMRQMGLQVPGGYQPNSAPYGPAYVRSQSLDRDFGSRRAQSRMRYPQNEMQQPYAAPARSYGQFGAVPRASRSRST